LQAHDLTPDTGLWWYYFAEVFPEYQTASVLGFTLLPALVLMALVVRFPKRPMFLLTCSSILLNLFQLKPSLFGACQYLVSFHPTIN
jgi:GPI-anchor transamidase subunit U